MILFNKNIKHSLLSIDSVPKIRFDASYHSVPPEDTVDMALSKLQRINYFDRSMVEDSSPIEGSQIYIHRVVEKNPKYNAWGKGLSEASSKASALMEFVERYSSENPVFAQHNIPLLSARKDLDLRSHSFDTLCAYNFQHDLYEDIVNLEQTPLLWSKVISLTNNEEVYIPTTRIFPNFHQDYIQDFCCTNGFSANNTIEEAIVQGLCEVIERHTLHLHALNSNSPRMLRIPLEQLENPDLCNSLDYLRKNGWIVVANLHDTGLPFFTTSVFMHNPKSEYIYRTEGSYVHFATASHFETSLSRCLSECVQSMAAEKIWRSQNGSRKLKFPTSVFSDLEKRLASEDIQTLKFTEYDDFSKDIDNAVSLMKKNGVEVLIADCTHPILEIPVVRVICPTLQPNFLLRNHKINSPRAIVSRHIENHEQIWNQAKRC
ncbi:YcaO-like family protein [Vibrio cyclitrophicus]|uniref:YcaO-like family protein n=1 Tax=Vibrio cyclitrophicus TaxID=47951 RepID=UPI000C847A87|nr:YcaO-like family protein [Vibrio cyclitrophicus]PMG07789.1 hypothetical protein BCU99_05695 [Vibrio cyclitrophicus]PMJ45958.1 hypothetical protein BCU22_22210 [Vibrio cyclitrophicus]